jgi:hypothetical protein
VVQSSQRELSSVDIIPGQDAGVVALPQLRA